MTEKKKKTNKRPKSVKWRPSPTGKSYGWRYPDGRTWSYTVSHPGTGRGGKGVKKSAAHRAAIAAAVKKAKNTPEAKAQQAERAKKQWADPEQREKLLERAKRGTASSQKTYRERAIVRKQTERALQAKLGWKWGSDKGEKRLIALKQAAARALEPYGVEMEEGQPMKYYIEIIEAFAPDLKPALDRYLKSLKS